MITTKPIDAMNQQQENKTAETWEDKLGAQLFDIIDEALPSFEFTLASSGRWVSKLHTDGAQSEEEASTVYAGNPLWIQDFARGAKSVVWAVVDIEHKAETYAEAVTYLCGLAGVEAPKLDAAQVGRQSLYRRFKEAQGIYHKALMSDTGREAQAVRDFLIRRGWTPFDIQESGVGYVSETTRAALYEEGQTVDNGIGKFCTLAIPVTSAGNVNTFKFRNVFATDKKNRYRGLAGVQRNSLGCLPLKGQADTVIVVEGELDALHDLAMWRQTGENEKKIDHVPVVSTGTGEVTKKMAEDAVRKGVTYFILAFDKDDHHDRHTTLSANNIHAAGGIALVMEPYPDGCKDLDEMYGIFAEDGGKKSRKYSNYYTQGMASRAQLYSVWKSEGIIPPSLIDGQGNVSDLQLAKVRRDLGRLIASTPEEERPSIVEHIDSLNLKEIDAHALAREIPSETRNKARSALLRRAADYLAEGNEKSAERALKRAQGIEEEATKKEAEFARVFQTLEPQQLTEFLATIPKGIPTGIKFKQGHQEEDLTLNAGLTFICGSRGHGKTSFLNNIALNEARRIWKLHTGKSVLYFSYEVDKRRLITDLLGTYVNDASLNRDKNPQDAIIAYFKGESRWISSQPMGGVGSITHLQNFEMKKAEFFRDYISSGAIVVVDEAYKVEKLLEAIKYYTARHTPSIVCIDYAQLIYSEDYSRMRTEEIKKVVNDIKDFANKQGIPFVLAAQFNREVNSPISVDTNNIGEGGDFERIADTCLGIFNLKELHPLVGKPDEEREAKKLLQALNVGTYNQGDSLKPIYGKIFVRLLKRRYGIYPLDIILDWEGRTKYIAVNNESALYEEPRQVEKNLFAAPPQENILF